MNLYINIVFCLYSTRLAGSLDELKVESNYALWDKNFNEKCDTGSC